MGRWQRKILFSLIVYCAGIATAVYVLAPVETQDSQQVNGVQSRAAVWAGVDQDDLVRVKDAMRLGVEKCKDFAEEHTARAAAFFRERAAGRNVDDG